MMRRETVVFVIAAVMAGCGGGGGGMPVLDTGSPADEGAVEIPDLGEVPTPEVGGDIEVLGDASQEAEVSDICALLKCEEMYKVFPEVGPDGKPIQVCFRWTCDPVRGQCVVEFLQGVRCDDGLECTRMDTCVDGRCVGLVDDCTCTGGTGECSDGDPCTLEDHCAANGKCLGGPEKDCKEHEEEAGDCRVVKCFLGVCMWSPLAEGEPCQSPNRCFLRGRCDGRGHCVEDLEAPQNCDDKNPCTDDGCDTSHLGADPETGCYHEPNTNPCDDKDACTENDQCQAGVCTGSPVDCEDGNPCTDDRPETCDPKMGCLHPKLPDGTDCDDKSECTPVSTCQNGLCIGPINCDDGDQCTDDSCGTDKKCRHEPHTRSCNDGDPCTQEDRCGQDGKCRGSPVPCPGNACNDGACEVIAGQGVCVLKPKAPGTPCDDGNGCSIGDACTTPGPSGTASCVGQAVTCAEKADECNDGVCIPVDSKTHVCVANPKVGKPPCEDGDLCTTGDYCQYGKCVSGGPKPCDPATDPCEQNRCDPATGQCVLSLKTGPCSDGNACTVGDVCVAGTSPEDGPGKCVGTLINCNDLNVCTLDTCDPEVGCRHAPRLKECSNATGVACLKDADCADGGKCIEVGCADDGNPCTRDICAEDGTCKHVGRYKECEDGRPCASDADCGMDGPCGPVACSDDGNECTVDYCWWDGTCRHFQRIKACPDGIPCLADSDCGGAPGSCLDVGPVACNDRDKCTLDDHCTLEGTCVGKPRDCTDYEKLPSGPTVKNVCTDDFCDQNNPAADPETGCYYVFNSNPCDDKDPCTRAEKCSGALCDACFFGHCQGPILRDCADTNPCTVDGCDQFHPGADAQGCWHDLVSPGTACDDLNLCTFNDRCDAMGVCRGEPVDCNDENQCTNEIGCDPVNGCIRTLVTNGTPCDDSNACTLGDRCFAGVCSGPNQVNCNDSNPCTVDWCLPTEGCQHNAYTCDDGFSCTTDTCKGDGSCQFTLKSGWCLIDGVCYASGTLNPNNDCQACNPSLSTSAWSNIGSGVACSDDGVSCTVDQCNGLGTCTHAIAPDWCRIGGICYVRDTLNPANDCQACNPSQSQSVWSNLANGATCADDGDWCTVDQCNGLGTCTHTTAAESCKIHGTCYAAGTINPANDCQECNPALSKTAWSNRTSGATCADDGVPCTLDQCNGLGTCNHPIASESCRIGGACYDRNDLNPSNDCQECNPSQSQTTWSSRPNGSDCADDGISCTLDQCNGLGTCVHPIANTSCRIDGTCYEAGTISITNDCKECNPTLSQTTWSNRGSGASCTDDGDWCTTDQCDGFGTCTHTTATESCKIDGVCYGAGFVNPANDCQECNPALSKSSWSNRTNGAACTDDNIACTLDRCNGLGACTHPIAPESCRIANTCYDAGTVNLANDCQECNPTLSQTAWSNRASGATCSSDNISCTLDQCNGFGVCQHILASDQCRIDGVCYASGVTNPLNPCQVCNPIQSQASWSNKASGTSCTEDGLTCTNDVCNADGECTHPVKSGFCLIGSACKNNGAENPDNQCQECNPAQNPYAWSAKSNGTLCSDNNACTLTDVCFNGSCQSGTPKTCTAMDQCHLAGTCDPATGNCSNPLKPNGTICNDNNQCTVGETCQNGDCTGGTPVVCNDNNPCTKNLCDAGTGCYYPPEADGTDCSSECALNATCQSGQCVGNLSPPGTSCTPDNYPCTNDVCNGTGVCTHPIQDGWCLIDGTCRTNGQLNPGNDCQACIPAQSQVTWSNRSSGSACNDGLFCTKTDTCNGSGQCVGSGNPCPGHNTGPNCNDSCNEATDNCTANDQAGTSCDDSIYCNGTDTCDGSGSCSIHSGNPCPGPDGDDDCSESCNEATDDCTANDPDNSVCDDGVYCNGTDKCSSGSCSIHSGDPCAGNVGDDDDDCSESCNETAHNCTANDPPGSHCNDGLFCTKTDTCNGSGLCVGSGNPCPGPDGDDDCSESCNEATDNCTANDPDNSVCDDGVYCNGTDKCSSGSCSIHSGDPCAGNVGDDDDDCSESCNETAHNCTANDPPGSHCNDGLFCTQTDACDASGTCVGSGNPCPGHNLGPNCNDSCNEETDNCTANDLNGTTCGDGKICCNGACVEGTSCEGGGGGG